MNNYKKHFINHFFIYVLLFITLIIAGIVIYNFSFIASIRSPYISSIDKSTNKSVPHQYKLSYDKTKKSAVIWKSEFEKQLKNKNWIALKYIYPIGKKNFKKLSFWYSSSFQDKLNQWFFHESLDQWNVGNDNHSLWTNNLNNQKETISLGIRKERNGWWLIFVSPNINFCPSKQKVNSCFIHLQINEGSDFSKKKNLVLKAYTPTNNKGNHQQYIYGTPLPLNIKYKKKMLWHVIINTNESINIDYNANNKLKYRFFFIHQVCRQKLLECF